MVEAYEVGKIALSMYMHSFGISIMKVICYLVSDDSLSYHRGQMFSTKDWDNDAATNFSCAEQSKGGWWYNNCHKANLNGLYQNPTGTSLATGINWFTWKGLAYSLKKTEMKIRRA